MQGRAECRAAPGEAHGPGGALPYIKTFVTDLPFFPPLLGWKKIPQKV